MNRRREVEVAIIGGGPAGLAAAFSASKKAASVMLLESAPWLGGQIWSGGKESNSGDRRAKEWLRRIEASHVEIWTGSTVIGCNDCALLVDRAEGVCEVSFGKLILATGARERFVPFPGWTLPNVFGVGALHNLAKQGWPVRGKRVVVAGSGPLLFSVAAHLRMLGAKVVQMAEQANIAGLMRFAAQLPLTSPSKILQGAAYQSVLLGVPYQTHCWPIEAFGTEKLEAVRLTNGTKEWELPCDYLACAFGLTANLELPQLLGCNIENGQVKTDEQMKTSLPNVYCAGEPTGIAGVDGSLTDGTIAGLAATGQTEAAKKYAARKARMDRFGVALAESFKLRDELKSLARPDTILCRCEDITVGQARDASDWRSAKLHHHTGMGHCQGRTCGGAVRYLFGWEPDSVRPPVFPVTLEKLAGFDQQHSP